VNNVDEKQGSLIIVEDNIDIANMLNDYVRNQGYTVSAVEIIKDNLSKRLKQSFDYFYRDQDRDSEKFLNQRLAADFFTIQAGQTFSKDVTQLSDEQARLCQACNP
jgi:hypothetical protein